MDMNPGEVMVMALPMSEDDDDGMSLECSRCGPVGITTTDEAEQRSIEHIQSHGGVYLGEET